MLITESTATFLAALTTLLMFGGLIVHICLPHNWQTWGVWMGISLLGIPAFLILGGIVVAYPWLIAVAVPLIFWKAKRLRKPPDGGE